MDVLFITVIIVSFAVSADARCTGQLLPNNPTAAVGGDLSLTCSVNTTTCPQANFMFTVDNEPVSPSFWNRTSPSSAVLQLKNLTVLNNGQTVKCWYGAKEFGQLLAVDYPPALPTNMECIVYNQQSMTCKWMFEHPYETHVDFKVYSTTKLPFMRRCPSPSGVINASKVIPPPEGYGYGRRVTFDPKIFRKGRDYCFRVEVASSFGPTQTKSYQVDNDISIVKPNPVRDLNVKKGSEPSTSLTLTFNAPSGIDSILRSKGGLLFKISYHSNWSQSNKMNHSFVSTDYSSVELSHTLTNLTPHTTYSITVRCKVNKTEDNKHWSDPKTTSHVTNSAVPELAPVVPPGAYSWLDGYKTRRLRIYWQKMRAEDEYGIPRGYSVIHNGRNSTFNDTNKLFQDFEIAETNEFKVYLLNDIGHSIKPSTLIVPNIDLLPPKPVNVGLKPNSRGDETSARLYWNRPREVESIDSYMIYICEQDSVSVCKGSIQSVSVSSEQTNYTIDFSSGNYGIEQDKASVGIATVSLLPNGTKAYSGILWACSFPVNGGAAAAPDVEKEVGYDSIKLSWPKLSCKESKSSVKYYQVEYWDVTYNVNSSKKITIDYWDDKVTTTLSSLHPNTAYMVIVLAVTENNSSTSSYTRITTKHVDISIKQLQYEDKVNISWAELTIKPEKIRASFDLKGEPRTVTYPISNTEGNHKVVNFNECSRLSVATVVQVNFYLLGDKDRVLSKKPSSPLKMCAPIPLSEGAIAGIAIGSIIAGIVLIVVLYNLCRSYRAEKQKTEQITKIVVPGSSMNGTVKPMADDDYFPNGRENPSNGYIPDWQTQNNNAKKTKDSGRGTMASSSSTAPLISQLSVISTDDVFEDSEKGKDIRRRNDSGLSYSKFDMTIEEETAGYMTRDQFARSDSYIDNEAISEASDFDEHDAKEVPSPLTEEYSKFGMEPSVIDLKTIKPVAGPGYINPDQITAVTMRPSPVCVLPQVIDNEPSDFDKHISKEALPSLTEEYSKFGMEPTVIELRSIKPVAGPGYINPDQITGVPMRPSPVHALPQVISKNYIDKETQSPISVMKMPPTKGAKIPSPIIAPPGGGFRGDDDSGPGSYAKPPNDNSASNSGYVVYGENGVIRHPEYTSDYDQDGSAPNTRLGTPIKDNVGYVPHEALNMPLDSDEIDSGVDDGSGETLPRNEKRDSGYMSPEYTSGSFSFNNARNNGTQNTDSICQGSTSSNESVDDARNVSYTAPYSGNDVNAGYLTETQLKMIQSSSRASPIMITHL